MRAYYQGFDPYHSHFYLPKPKVMENTSEIQRFSWILGVDVSKDFMLSAVEAHPLGSLCVMNEPEPKVLDLLPFGSEHLFVARPDIMALVTKP